MSERARILVASDLSPGAGLAVQRASILAAEHGAELLALHVTLAEETEYEPDEAGLLLDEQVRSATAELGELSCQVKLVEGKPFIQIIRCAREHDASLIVVGAHGRDADPAPLLGTTAQRVVRQTDRPVLVVRRPATQRYRRVMVGTDLSAASEDALATARSIAPSASFDLVHAYTLTGWKKLQHAGASENERREFSRQLEATATDDVLELLHRHGLSRGDVALLIQEGPATQLIARLAEQRSVELLAVGTSGASALRQVLLGSVAEHVLRDAPCDVLAVRHGAPGFELP